MGNVTNMNVIGPLGWSQLFSIYYTLYSLHSGPALLPPTVLDLKMFLELVARF